MDLRELDGSADGAKAVRHPWEVARFRFFHEILSQAGLGMGALHKDCKILDIGSGDAWFAGQLAREESLTNVTCWDLNYDEQSAERLGVDTKTIRLTNDRPDGKFDLVMMLDVLEHIEDDVTFLQQTVETNLRPGGRLLISVPAWQQLYSSHDHWLHHFRRYLPAEFHQTLDACQLRPIEKGGLFHSLLLPRSLAVARERLTSKLNPMQEHAPKVEWLAGPLTTKLVTTALQADNWISHLAAGAGVSLPGLSVWALCEQS